MRSTTKPRSLQSHPNCGHIVARLDSFVIDHTNEGYPPLSPIPNQSDLRQMCILTLQSIRSHGLVIPPLFKHRHVPRLLHTDKEIFEPNANTLSLIGLLSRFVICNTDGANSIAVAGIVGDMSTLAGLNGVIGVTAGVITTISARHARPGKRDGGLQGILDHGKAIETIAIPGFVGI